MKVILQNNDEDCLLACYTMLLNDLGYKVPLYEVYQRDSLPADGLSVSYLRTLNKKFNVDIKAYKANFDEIMSLLRAKGNNRMIAHWNNDHFVVLEKINQNYIKIVDPAIGKIKFSKTEFLNHYSGTIITVYPTADFHRQKVNTLFLKYLKKTLNVRSGVTFLFALILIEISVLLFSIVIRNMMAGNLKLISSLLLFFTIILLQVVGCYIKNFSLEEYNSDFDKSYTSILFKRLLDKPLLYFRNHTNGSVSEKISFRTTVRDSVASRLIPSIVSLVSSFVICVYLSMISFGLTILLLSMILIYSVISLVLYHKQNEYNQSYLQYLIDFNSDFQSDLAYIDYIKVMRNEKGTEERWVKNNDRLTRKYSQILKVENFVQLIGSIFSYFSLSVIILLVIYYNKFFHISIEDLVLFQTSTSLFISSIEQVKNSIFEIARLAVYAEKQGDILKENLPIHVTFDLESNYIIQTEDLNFAYGNEPLYKPVNLKISQGEKVAIVGKSGSGKSTLLLLLAGVLRYSGKLTYNNEHLENYMGVVLQNMTLKKGSVLENFEYDSPDITKLYRILVDTTADEVVAKLPNKLQSKLLKQGKNLSGGQIQKLLIAKSLLKGEKIIFWDEAFSNLDEVSKDKIYENVLLGDFYKDQTMLIVSHHLDIVKYVGSVIFINDETGEVIKSTHEYLQNNNSEYKKFISNNGV
ncbi:ATP-binding cassette domain-containing protein [Atopobacter sp. AH10]|uniref:cysteine peptidase family C39 domain-containing protein n=1 Tax=Atopobacter sp. AH10 TaxID=2315861 RepID=UPI000EF1EF16|nr:cysteine peptidase family C39 domain-containing protein [Atopobacter sp. AH10]RLK63952.1 ATP-binding cassette domain-containing protein [Atopobacter sp. AH10]